MLYSKLWLNVAGALAVTLIIPKNYPNHRLTYMNGPRLINSALNESTRTEDYFSLPDQVTNLPSKNKTMCSFPGRGLYPCARHDTNEVLFSVHDSVREVRLEDIDRNCLTAGLYDDFNDSYEVVSIPCDDQNTDQVFILNRDHGHDGTRIVDRLNITNTPAKELRNSRQYDRFDSGMFRQ